MGYATYQTKSEYKQAQAGAFAGVILQNEADPAQKFVNPTTSFSWAHEAEAIEIEEGGNSEPSEIVDGRWNAPAGTITLIPRQDVADSLPNPQDYIGKRWTIVYYKAKSADSTLVGTVLHAITGCVLAGQNVTVPNRGIVSQSVTFRGLHRYTGAQWADMTGAM